LATESEIKKILCGKVSHIILRSTAVYDPRDKDVFVFFNLGHKHFRLRAVTKRFLQLIYAKDVANGAVTPCLGNKKNR
jgi:dTDP-4-dehydrorhamnose reductase